MDRKVYLIKKENKVNDILTPDQYVIYAKRQLNKYINGVQNGSIVSNKYIKLAVKEFLEDYNKKNEKGEFVWDRKWDKVYDIFKFFSFLNIELNDEWKQFKILPFQAFFIVGTFLFYHKGTNTPKVRYTFLFMARGNGKTPLAVALQLYLLVAGGYAVPQSLLVASTREQAGIALAFAKDIINHSPALSKRLENFNYKILFKNKNKSGFMKTLASNAGKLDGYKPTTAILDEIHSYQDDSLFNVIKSGLVKKNNSLGILISTAGFGLNSFCYDYVGMCQNKLDKKIKDDSIFCLLYTLDDTEEIKQKDTWVKSNPGLGHIIRIEELEGEYNQAKNFISQRNNFLTKNLNLFTNSLTSWIPETTLTPCFKKVNEDELAGKDCYIGLDLSSTRDLTSLVCLFPKEDGTFDTIPYFFFANNVEKKIRKGGIDLSVWIKQGYIIQCQTETIDYDLIFDKFIELKEKFNIINVGYDQFNSALIVGRLKENGINCEHFSQTAQRFNLPLKYLEKLIFDNKINLSESPVLLWNFRNVVLYIDGNGNIKIMKNKSLDSVDGCVSLGMALGSYLNNICSDLTIGLDDYIKNA